MQAGTTRSVFDLAEGAIFWVWHRPVATSTKAWQLPERINSVVRGTTLCNVHPEPNAGSESETSCAYNLSNFLHSKDSTLLTSTLRPTRGRLSFLSGYDILPDIF